MTSPEELEARECAAQSLLRELELAQRHHQDALKAAELQGFNAGMQHAIETFRDNPDARPIACAIVEDWVRALTEPYRWGLDISFRKHELADASRSVGLWNEEGRIDSKPTLFEALEALAHKDTTTTEGR